jgi:hypothetical protein
MTKNNPTKNDTTFASLGGEKRGSGVFRNAPRISDH